MQLARGPGAVDALHERRDVTLHLAKVALWIAGLLGFTQAYEPNVHQGIFTCLLTAFIPGGSGLPGRAQFLSAPRATVSLTHFMSCSRVARSPGSLARISRSTSDRPPKHVASGDKARENPAQ